MNRYIITCINDFETYSGYAAYAESLFDEDMNNAADAYAFEIAVGIVPDSFIVTTEGYEYHNMTEEAIRQVVDSIEWEDYYNYKITPYEGTDEEFDKSWKEYSTIYNFMQDNFSICQICLPPKCRQIQSKDYLIKLLIPGNEQNRIVRICDKCGEHVDPYLNIYPQKIISFSCLFEPV